MAKIMAKTIIGLAAAGLMSALTLTAPAGAVDSKRSNGLANPAAQATEISAQRRRVVRRSVVRRTVRPRGHRHVRRHWHRPRVVHRHRHWRRPYVVRRPSYGYPYYAYTPYSYYQPYYYGRSYYRPSFYFGFGF